MNEEFNMSSDYAWLRTREFEGTFPGSKTDGVWDASFLRVAKFYGQMKEKLRYRAWPPPEPPSAYDGDSRLVSRPYYRRLYTFSDCIAAFRQHMSVKASFFVTKEWESVESGILDFHQSEQDVIGGHAMALLPPLWQFPTPIKLPNDDFVLAQNSWGSEWGNDGFGVVTRTFFSNYMYGCWAFSPCEGRPVVSTTDTAIVKWIESTGETGEHHVVEIFKEGVDNPVAWMFASIRHNKCYVDEFFVVPEYRGQGFGQELMDRVHELHQETGGSPVFWIAFADVDSETKRDDLVRWVSKHKLHLHNSPAAFAAYIATPTPRTEDLSPLVLPPKPAYSFFTPTAAAPDDQFAELAEEFKVSQETMQHARAMFLRHRDAFARLAK